MRLCHVRQMIDSEANSGTWNMAVDEALLQSAIDQEIATLRWYRWREPTVSLGYFQRKSDIEGDPRLSHLPCVRRLSGGGTLVHDCELTYSLTLPGSQRLVERPADLYRVIHGVFVDVFRERGVELCLRGVTVKRSDEPVLCFAREDEHDLVLKSHKVLGSAQRRRRGAILQHGGLLLKASPITPDLLGIGNLCPTASLVGLEQQLGRSILREIAETDGIATLTPSERDLAEQLAASR